MEHGQLQSIPVSIFADIAQPDVHFYMDACDAGLIALHPATKRYIYVEFDGVERAAITAINNRANGRRKPHLTEHMKVTMSGATSPENKQQASENRKGNKDFSINVREFFSMFLATMLWGPELADANRMIHIKSWIDNSAAVSWTNKLASPNELAQQLLRVMCLVLAKHRIHVSSDHIPGEWNFMPDHGSRMSLSTSSSDIWKSFSLSWSRTHVPPSLRYAYKCVLATTNTPHWPHPRDGPTLAPGPDGHSGQIQSVPTLGYTKTSPSTHLNSYDMPGTSTSAKSTPTGQLLSCPRSALSLGIIRPPETSQSAYPPDTRLMSKEWRGPASPTDDPTRLHRLCYAATTELSSLPLDETTPFGAALSSPSFSACEQASTPVLPPKRDTMSVKKTSSSRTSAATLPALSKKRNLSTSSFEAARPIKRHEVAPDHSLDQATPSSARSSLRGACELLARRSKPAPQTHSVFTLPRVANDTTSLFPSSPTPCEKQRDTAGKTHELSRHTPSEAAEQLKCFSEEVPTQQSNYLDDGSRMHTNSTSASKPARTNASHLK